MVEKLDKAVEKKVRFLNSKMSGDFLENRRYLCEKLDVKRNFDVIYRDIEIGGRKAGFFSIDGFCKDETMQKMMQYFLSIKPEDMPQNATGMTTKCMPYVEVDINNDWQEIIQNILSGVFALIIDGYEECILIDARTYPARGVEEPDKDKVLRGSKDGFVETIVFNTALIRRRIRSADLCMEMMREKAQKRILPSAIWIAG